MNKFEFFKEWHYKELERCDSFSKELNLPILILTALISVFAYLTAHFWTDNIDLAFSPDLIFFSFIILGLFTIGKILFHITQMYIGSIRSDKYSKMVIPIASDLNDYFNQVKEVKQEEQMITYFIECLDHNTKSNEWKSIQSYKSKVYTVIFTVIVSLMSIEYIVDKFIEVI